MGDAQPLSGPPVVTNEVRGTHGVVVQAGTIHGGVQIRVPALWTTVPRQLPADTAHFTGRAAELARLDERLLGPGSDRLAMAVLSGPAGVGKTALALSWAHRAADHFTGGQLYADLDGFGVGEPVKPAQVLSGFLRALGMTRLDELVDLRERASHFRTLLSGRRALVILDNAHSAEQVRPLLPGTGPCVVIVTSRRRLGSVAIHHAAEQVELSPLPPAAGVRLLAATVGERVVADRRAAIAIVAQCGGLPLALRIVAHRAVSRASLRLVDLVTELSDQQRRLDVLSDGDSVFSVRAALSWSYEGLEENVASAFRLMGWLPGHTVDAPALAAARATTTTHAAAVLADLADAHLIAEPVSGRYSMHDLLRTYATELATAHTDDKSRADALRRLFDHYLLTAARADRLIAPNRFRVVPDGDPSIGLTHENAEAAREWVRVELPNLVALCRVDDPALDSRRWQLAFVLRSYFYLTKELDAWVETHRQALAASVRLGDRHAEALTRNNLGQALTAVRRLDEAADQHRAAQQLFRLSGDERGQSDCLANLAAVLRRQGRFEEALAHQRLALDHYVAAGLIRNSGITLRSMSGVHLELGQVEDAVRCADEALSVAVGQGHDLDTAQAFNSLAVAHERAGDAVRAEVAFRQALEVGARCDSHHEQARAHRGLGTLAMAAGKVDEAEAALRAALLLYERLASPEAPAVAALIARLKRS